MLQMDALRLLLRNENATMPANTTDTPTPAPQASKIVEIVVPIVVILAVILTVILVLLFCVVRKKRQTEGTYHPSAEEQTGDVASRHPTPSNYPKRKD